MDLDFPLTASWQSARRMVASPINSHKPAVAVRFAAPDAESAPGRTHLRRGAANKRLDFFSRANCDLSEIRDSRELSARRRRANAR